MQKELRVIDQSKGIVQITTQDERYYSIASTNAKTGLPEYQFIPSVTWITSYYPKGLHFYRWVADKGGEAEALKVAAGERGSRIHNVTELLENGSEFNITDMIDMNDGSKAELDASELFAVNSFVEWHKENKPKCLANEIVVFGKDKSYAGTCDRIYLIDGKVWIVDIKTSAQIWQEHILQVSAYSHADIEYKSLGVTDEQWAERGLAILQVGYKLNKKGYKFSEVEDKFDLFQMAQSVWKNENPDDKPRQINIPLKLKLN